MEIWNVKLNNPAQLVVDPYRLIGDQLVMDLYDKKENQI